MHPNEVVSPVPVMRQVVREEAAAGPTYNVDVYVEVLRRLAHGGQEIRQDGGPLGPLGAGDDDGSGLDARRMDSDGSYTAPGVCRSVLRRLM